MLDHARCLRRSQQTFQLTDKAANTVQFSCVSLLEEVKGDSPIDTRPHPLGMALSQTTPSPTVMSTALAENVTSLTVTPVILSSTTPGCGAFNLSTCELCAPGSQYDNSESQIRHITLYVMF